MNFCKTVGWSGSDMYKHDFWSYKFADSDAGTKTKHDLNSPIIIEFVNDDVITYKMGEV